VSKGRAVDRTLLRCLAPISALLPWVPACFAEPPGSVPSIQGPEIMLYISQPIGPSVATRTYGLRIDQHSLPAALPGATSSATDLSGRRELVNIQVNAHENTHIDFGKRVSWDFSRWQFNMGGDLPAMKMRFPSRTVAATTPIAPPLTSGALRMPALP
jgi:hypothetical protein